MQDIKAETGGEPTINRVAVPIFLKKLWKMINDPLTADIITWNSTGDCIQISDEVAFWNNLLPLYYKHNNMSSFIRQLNFYGFHKVSAIDGQVTRRPVDRDRDETLFYHPNFKRGHPELLPLIKRKVSISRTADFNADNKNSIKMLLCDIKKIRSRQATVDQQLEAVREENVALWTELTNLRQAHNRQQKVINRIMHFLVTLVQQKMEASGKKRKGQVMICEIPLKTLKSNAPLNSEVLIQELDPEYNNLDNAAPQSSYPNTTAGCSNEPSLILPEPEILESQPSRASTSKDFQQGSADKKYDLCNTLAVSTIRPEGSSRDITDHVETTQMELGQLKDILSDSNLFDDDMLMNLFNDKSITELEEEDKALMSMSNADLIDLDELIAETEEEETKPDIMLTYNN